MLRLDFPGYTGPDKLEEISWDEFFEKFDERDLSLLVQDKTARGQKSNFNKLVSRQTAPHRRVAQEPERRPTLGIYSRRLEVPILRVRARSRRQD